MTDFREIFDSKMSRVIQYKDKELFLEDFFPVKDGDVLSVSIESTNSEFKQGLYVNITGHCEIDGNKHKKGKGIRSLYWEDTCPKESLIKVFTKKGFVKIANIWESTTKYLLNDENNKPFWKENKSLDYGHWGSAMIVEPIEGGRRYRCNDRHPDEDFDDIIFTVKNLTSPDIMDKKFDMAFGQG
ncbi:hypothetical protein N9Y92_04540 [Chlamydiales bacterium]|nr:hypothetical protein [Chlamydiales bacterium]